MHEIIDDAVGACRVRTPTSVESSEKYFPELWRWRDINTPNSNTWRIRRRGTKPGAKRAHTRGKHNHTLTGQEEGQQEWYDDSRTRDRHALGLRKAPVPFRIGCEV